jgi:hypothetical protein
LNATGDPVSWLMIEPGWTVVDAAGDRLGTVDEVAGDSGHDIFDGLAVVSGVFARPRYVPAEAVGTITEGRVQLRLERRAFERLGEFEEPPSSEVISSEKAGLVARAEESLVGGERDRPQRVPFLRRLYVRFMGRLRGR